MGKSVSLSWLVYKSDLGISGLHNLNFWHQSTRGVLIVALFHSQHLRVSAVYGNLAQIMI